MIQTKILKHLSYLRHQNTIVFLLKNNETEKKYTTQIKFANTFYDVNINLTNTSLTLK